MQRYIYTEQLEKPKTYFWMFLTYYRENCPKILTLRITLVHFFLHKIVSPPQNVI